MAVWDVDGEVEIGLSMPRIRNHNNMLNYPRMLVPLRTLVSFVGSCSKSSGVGESPQGNYLVETLCMAGAKCDFQAGRRACVCKKD
jgi:hypothetical protein